MTADQDPVILLFDVVGKAGIELPKQKGPTAAKVGVMLWSIETVSIVTSPH